jgi:hypothetical protein
LTADCASCKDAHTRRFPLAALIGLGLCLLLCGVASCGDGFNFLGTPMPNEQNCKYVPDVESCTSEADKITETCLHDCVMNLCKSVKIVCTEETIQQCKATTEDAGASNVGFVNSRVPRQTCLDPVTEINWCQLSVAPQCQAKGMVHELAHACGWEEFGGLGVPGGTNGGMIQCN